MIYPCGCRQSWPIRVADCCSLSPPGGCGSAVSRCCRPALAACCLPAAGTPRRVLPTYQSHPGGSGSLRHVAVRLRSPRLLRVRFPRSFAVFRETREKQLKVSWNYFNSVWGRSTSSSSSTSPSALPDLTSRLRGGLIVKVTDGTSGNRTVLRVLLTAVSPV